MYVAVVADKAEYSVSLQQLEGNMEEVVRVLDSLHKASNWTQIYDIKRF